MGACCCIKAKPSPGNHSVYLHTFRLLYIFIMISFFSCALPTFSQANFLENTYKQKLIFINHKFMPASACTHTHSHTYVCVGLPSGQLIDKPRILLPLPHSTNGKKAKAKATAENSSNRHLKVRYNLCPDEGMCPRGGGAEGWGNVLAGVIFYKMIYRPTKLACIQSGMSSLNTPTCNSRNNSNNNLHNPFGFCQFYRSI